MGGNVQSSTGMRFKVPSNPGPPGLCQVTAAESVQDRSKAGEVVLRNVTALGIFTKRTQNCRCSARAVLTTVLHPTSQTFLAVPKAEAVKN